jgi:alkanesulfonate monooxygenase SsuD/methylene tetrahydromethanopterin reductase-like flavin-dependent oxidoreductase (luciferase family)
VATKSPIPIGVNLTAIGVTAEWWLESALRIEAAGFRTIWAWDHFISRGTITDPCLECWTLLSATAARTRTLRVGSFVSNVMNRHPAVLARMAATVADIAGAGERVELGIGIGGHPKEHEAYGIDFPEPKARAARLEEAIQVIRLLLSGGPADFSGRYYNLRQAPAYPAPSPAPRVIVGGESPAGGRIAARLADGLTTFAAQWDRVYPVFLEEMRAAGRNREEVSVLVAADLEESRGSWSGGAEPDMLSDLGAVASRWHERGADELVLHWVKPDQLDAVIAAGERAGLSG